MSRCIYFDSEQESLILAENNVHFTSEKMSPIFLGDGRASDESPGDRDQLGNLMIVCSGQFIATGTQRIGRAKKLEGQKSFAKPQSLISRAKSIYVASDYAGSAPGHAVVQP